MANENDNTLTDSDKLRIVADFILHAPPGEFQEVFYDVRQLLNNDTLLKDKASSIFAQYRKDQLTPVNLSNGTEFALITEFNDLGSNRFYDPKTRKSFKYDFLTEETSDHGHWEPDSTSESWRSTLDDIWSNYCIDHYYKGISSVFATTNNNNNDQITLSACIEAHQFQPNNFWNGLWRSIWIITLKPNRLEADIFGKIKAQVHYYENGNVQLVSFKEIKESISFTDEKSMAENFRMIVEEAENEYQIAISQNYQNMSDTTFKALRRALPVTRSKIDWHKIMSYRIANDIKQT
ncbi:F-actin-capping protein subunit alpha [Dermatophagoides pteronyssinus]|uniref:F-actin-capping protein subunit alpha n=1 Tax=Dermatophagoides pteronyssinus TaxID=6956 RepID=UPI003F677AC3